MAREIDKLTTLNIKNIKEAGRYSDGAGLWLQVTRKKKISRSWLYQFTAPNGKVRQMGLGPYPQIGLAVARELAAEMRKLVASGKDPIEERNRVRLASRAAEAKRITFEEAAEKYIEAHRLSWKNAKHRQQWPSTLATYAYPIIGDLDVATIETAHVLSVLEPIWTTKPETATRVRARIKNVLDRCRALKQRTGENPAAWRDNLDQVLPRSTKLKKVRHHPALPFIEIPAFMAELRKRKGVSPRALEFTILTAARTNETIGAKWKEFNFATKIWTIPADRMKAGREHRVPLSDRAMEILASVPREEGNPHVFIGGKKGVGLSDMAMLTLLKEMRPALTVHGFRSTFRDWASETTPHANIVVEMALAHTVKDATEAAYRRGDLLQKRRVLMTDWMRHCRRTPVANNVTDLSIARSTRRKARP